ncbi:hypothetical protein [Sporosarcina jiandibaonis]|uniref:hypothetical protein n=1 Tax=Sporosarcina jiandibaonis TaxID=2715535 RepID=UPI0015544ABC|nr:hypothetical protein [Sporosarcina jiandibaonis]
MGKNLQFIGIVFLGVSVLLGAWVVSQSPSNNVRPSTEEQYRYEFISANESNVIIFDKKTGDYWQKFISSSEGPTEWEKQKSPATEKK